MSNIKITDIVNYLYKNRTLYKTLRIEDKKYWFFIINRYLSKIYPKQAQEFNIKGIDESICMDLWFIFLQGKSDFLWSKSKFIKEKVIKIDKELLSILDIEEEDYIFLSKYYPNELKLNK